MDRTEAIGLLTILNDKEVERLHGKTHYSGCWEFHINCALSAALGIIEDLQQELEEATAKIPRSPEAIQAWIERG
jgi:hypothetical protein